MDERREGLKREVFHNLTLHPPTDPIIGDLMDEVRSSAKDFASDVIDKVPASRELSMAVRAIEDACMYAIAGLARHQVQVLTDE